MSTEGDSPNINSNTNGQYFKDDLKYVADCLNELTGTFEPNQPHNVLDCRYRPAKVIDIDSDSSDSDDIEEKIDNLQKMQVKDDNTGPIRTIHEIPLEEAEVGQIPSSISPDASIVPIARVQYFSGSFSIAKSINGEGASPGSLLCDSNRTPITRVLELFGPISDPQFILKGQIPIGTELFAVVPESVFPDPELIAKQFRGCDASNRFDEEEPYQNFSDDEEEREYKKQKKLAKKAKVGESTTSYPSYPRNH